MDNTSRPKFEVFSINGTVIEIIKDSETVVSGRGGEGRTYTLPTGHVQGYTSGISIESETLKKTTIWIKTDDDREIDFTFDGELKARQGHIVTFICVRDLLNGSTAVSKLLNHTTNMETTFISDNLLPHNFGHGNTLPRPPYEINIAKNLIIMFVLFLIIQLQFSATVSTFSIVLLIIIAIPMAIYHLVKRSHWKKNDLVLAKKNDEINALYKETCLDLGKQIQESVTNNVNLFRKK